MEEEVEVEEAEAEEEIGGRNDNDDYDDESLFLSIHAQHITTQIATVWRKRKPIFNSNYAITGWILATNSQVREDVLTRMNGSHHDSVEYVSKKLYAHDIDINIGKINDTFWDEFKQFQNKTGSFKVASRWNTTDAVNGNSHL